MRNIYFVLLTIFVWTGFYLNPTLSFYDCSNKTKSDVYIFSGYFVLFWVFLGIIFFKKTFQKIGNAWINWYFFMLITVLWEAIKYCGKIFQWDWQFLSSGQEYYNLQWQLYFGTSIIYAIYLIIKGKKCKKLFYLIKQK